MTIQSPQQSPIGDTFRSMSTPTATSHTLRLLVCLRCGAPFEVAPTGGHYTCAFCQSTHELRPREESPASFVGTGALPPQAPKTEAERFAALRAQMTALHPYDYPPAPVRRLARSATDLSRLPEAEALFRQAESKVLAGGGFDAEVELFWITGVLRTLYLTKHEYVHARAVDETALETLTDPVMRTVQRTALANRACDAMDLEDAETWLAPCPRESEVLAVHTHVRLTEARIALLRGAYDVALERLGRAADDVPLRIDRDAMACLYRAAVYEKMGQLDAAAKALDESTRHLGGKIYALAKITDLKDAWPRFPLCEQTYPAFRTRFLMKRALHVALLGAGLAGSIACLGGILLEG